MHMYFHVYTATLSTYTATLSAYTATLSALQHKLCTGTLSLEGGGGTMPPMLFCCCVGVEAEGVEAAGGVAVGGVEDFCCGGVEGFCCGGAGLAPWVERGVQCSLIYCISGELCIKVHVYTNTPILAESHAKFLFIISSCAYTCTYIIIQTYITRSLNPGICSLLK